MPNIIVKYEYVYVTIMSVIACNGSGFKGSGNTH